jgi:hypothetical protein
MACGESVSFTQAKVTILCRKIYQHDFQREGIPEEVIERYYQTEEPHTMYIGEVVEVFGEDE